MLITDPFNIIADPTMPFLSGALDPVQVQPQFAHHLPPHLNTAQLRAIRVIRHKPGRRCLIEYDLEMNPSGSSQLITLIGKVRAKGTDVFSYRLQHALWNAGFTADSEDGISVPEPVAAIPAFHMWLQHKVPGTIATQLLPQPNGVTLAQRIAEAADKLHRAGIPSHRRHTIVDELQILHDRLPLILQQHPTWQQRLEDILDACDRLGSAMPQPNLQGIHRDFYPDQIIVDGDRLYLLDLDLYCEGDPSLDIGNFIGHITEQSLRTLGSIHTLADREAALENHFLRLNPATTQLSIQAYTTLTLVRHIYLSTQFPNRRPFTQSLLELCEHRLAQLWSRVH
ncbi:phosphotransferase [Oculatella sp. LEGE 06141]|uniref:phosphotransferase n=1 Tax=Oculatella sp. LEGE 06141 TaxID=1828648 RepID=UPI0030DDAD58